MKKIKAKFNSKDRIVCVTIPGGHQFFYQPFGTKDRYWLFDVKDFSGSIFAYFRNHGRNLNDLGYSITLNELYYEFKGYRNPKLSKLVERIPSQVEYVIREYIDVKPKEAEKQHDEVREPERLYPAYDDYECAA